MKRIIVVLILISTIFSANAQEIVNSPMMEDQESSWYKEQATLWQEVVKKNPQNEDAWHNLFKAAFYYEKGKGKQAPMTTEICEQMGKAIPDSYRYYYCMYRTQVLLGNPSADEYAQKAIQHLPSNIHGDEINTLIFYILSNGDLDNVNSNNHQIGINLLNQQFQDKVFSERLYRLVYNQFLGMEDNGIEFIIGDRAYFPAIIIQEVLHCHQDKQLVCLPLLWKKTYRTALFKKLGIEEFTDEETYRQKGLHFEDYQADIIKYIIEKTGRNGYFFCSRNDIPASLAKNVYNEGLLYKYSEKPYDNVAIAKRNVETRYHLDYLTEPDFTPDETHIGYELFQLNYSVLLAYLIREYKLSGEKDKAKWLERQLIGSINNSQVDEKTKKGYWSILMIQSDIY